MLLASLSFALMGAVVKVLARNLPSVELVFFRNLLGTALILLSIWRRPLRQVGGKPRLLVFRGVIGTLALYAFFYNISTLSLAEASVYSNTAPLFVSVLAWLLLGERLSLGVWLGLLGGFAGIALIFQPGLSTHLQSNVLGLISGLLAAFAYLAVRDLKRVYDTRAIVLSFLLSGIVLPAISLAWGTWKPPSPVWAFAVSPFYWPQGWDWAWLILLGVTALAGQVFLTKAYGAERAGIVAGMSYSAVVFSMLLGVALGDGWPGWLTLSGIALIIGSGVLISVSKR
jgi:drug/metabolite transporter (DMT)-like permease